MPISVHSLNTFGLTLPNSTCEPTSHVLLSTPSETKGTHVGAAGVLENNGMTPLCQEVRLFLDHGLDTAADLAEKTGPVDDYFEDFLVPDSVLDKPSSW